MGNGTRCTQKGLQPQGPGDHGTDSSALETQRGADRCQGYGVRDTGSGHWHWEELGVRSSFYGNYRDLTLVGAGEGT